MIEVRNYSKMKAELGWCPFGKGTSLPATRPEYQINPYQKTTQVLHCSGAVPSVKKKNWVSNWHQHYRTPWSAWPGKFFPVLASGPARNPYNPLDPTRADASEDPNPKEGDLSVIPCSTKPCGWFPVLVAKFFEDKKTSPRGFGHRATRNLRAALLCPGAEPKVLRYYCTVER